MHRRVDRAPILVALHPSTGVAMDLAACCADLLYRLRSGRRRLPEPPQRDPADMGTAYGLEASLAPPPDIDDDPSAGRAMPRPSSADWLRPR